MARIETDPNYTTPTFSRATAATDPFKKEDVQNLAAAFSTHVHDGTGKGLAIAATGIPAGTITGAMIVDGTITSADIADGTITSADIADGTIVAADMADATITNAKLGPDVARANLLTNGGFEIWQRGVGPFAGNYTADRWAVNLGAGSTQSVTRATGMSSIGYALQTVYTHSALSGIIQDLQIGENPLLLGKTVTFSADVNASAAGAAALNIVTNGSGAINVTSSVHPGGSTWQRLTVTGVINGATNDVQVRLNLTASATVLIDNAMVVVGAQAANYVPMHPADDLTRCLRYYELSGAVGGNDLAVRGYSAAAGAQFEQTMIYRAIKSVTPTVTKAGTWTVANCGQPTIPASSQYSVRANITSTGTGDTYAVNTGAGGPTIVVEANP